MFKIIVFVSGNGSNLEAIIESCKLGILDATVQLVVSNKPNAFALERAKNHMIESKVVPYDKNKFKTREAYDKSLAAMINGYDYDLVVLAGFMHVLTNEFITNVRSPLINLHPSLPGEFVGLNAIERAFEASKDGSVCRTGCMVHHVIEELDAGTVIGAFEIPIRENETLDTLKHKFQYYEKFLLVSSIDKILATLTAKKNREKIMAKTCETKKIMSIIVEPEMVKQNGVQLMAKTIQTHKMDTLPIQPEMTKQNDVKLAKKSFKTPKIKK